MLENHKLADRYEVGEIIGYGGMAEVHLGTDLRLNRKVAIKILKRELASDPVFLERFRREAQAAASLNHAAIVAVYDTGEEEEIPFIVMEYVEGKTVRDILASAGKLSVNDSVDIIEGILSALVYSHKVGIIHRDIKPANVMITSTGNVKVMDFGIARAQSDSAVTISSTQGVVGTAQYLSPEQARGETVDTRSDLYSVGCMLFELLTGRPPFQGDTPVSIAYQHVDAKPPVASEINPEIPVQFDNVIEKALAKDVSVRYQTAEDFSSDLAKAKAGEKVSPAPSSAPTVVLKKDEVEKLNAFAPSAKGAKTTDSNDDFSDDFFNELGGFDEASDAEITGTLSPTSKNSSEESASKTGAKGTEKASKKKMDPKKKMQLMIAGGIAAVLLLVLIVILCVNAFSPKEAIVVQVPTFSTSTTKDRACARLEQLKLVCDVQDDSDSASAAGTVTKTDPAAGTSVSEGAKVTVYVSTGPADGKIPDVKSKSEEEAKKILTDAGYKVSVVHEQDCQIYTGSDKDEAAVIGASCEAKENDIIGTIPSMGSDAKKGTSVTIYKATGKATIPDLKGKTKDETNDILGTIGLNVEFEDVDCTDTKIEANLVCATDPASGTNVKLGSSVKVKTVHNSKVVVKDYKGVRFDVAQLELANLGFKVKVEGSELGYNGVNEGLVYAQTPGPGELEPGQTITLLYFKKPAPTTPTQPTPQPSVAPSANPSHTP